jgi:aspartate kinase
MIKPIVHKFGGSSVRDAGALRRVQNILQSLPDGPTLIVTSAAAGVTDQLVQVGDESSWQELRGTLLQRHAAMARDLDLDASWIENYLQQASAILQVPFSGNHSHARAELASCGERLMAPLLSEALRKVGLPARPFDSRDFILTDDSFLAATVDLPASCQLIQLKLLPELDHSWPVLPGFIAANRRGQTTLLGRNGSDFSASIFGAGLQAGEVWIWTDVNGIYTADPRHHAHSKHLSEISFREAAEAAYFGARVVHPYTMWPLLESQTNLRIKNTFQPEHAGTLICHQPQARGLNLITTAIRGVVVVTVGGYGLLGVPGVASKVFGAISRAGTNVLMISQSSSEHNISFVIRAEDLATTHAQLQAELAEWMQREHRIDRIKVVENAAILTVVGENMRGRAGVAGTIFSALGEAGINVVAIAQGSSEYSISIVVAQEQLLTACDAILEKAGIIYGT